MYSNDCDHLMIDEGDNRADDPLILECRYRCQKCGTILIERHMRMIGQDTFNSPGSRK